MAHMQTSLRGRLAMFALMGAFLIPISVSSLRGLTHVLTCEQKVETPFTMVIHKDRPPEVLSSTKITRGQQEGLCGGLIVDLRARSAPEQKVRLIVVIHNKTNSLWKGTVSLGLKGERSLSFPVEIGSIAAGKTRSGSVDLALPSGSTELAGSLLLGP